MVGSLGRISLSQLLHDRHTNQTTFDTYGGRTKTYICVARRTNQQMDLVCDEHMVSLGPPDHLLSEFLMGRQGRMHEGDTKEQAHEDTYRATVYEARYKQYLAHDPEDPNVRWYWPEERDENQPRAAIEQLVNRLINGEDMVLVCFCEEGWSCHTEVLKDEVYRYARLASLVPDRPEYVTLEYIEENCGRLSYEGGTQSTLDQM